MYTNLPYSPSPSQIKILKRQGDPTGEATPPSNTPVAKQHKSLAEREADYASARYAVVKVYSHLNAGLTSSSSSSSVPLRARILGTQFKSEEDSSRFVAMVTEISPI